MNDWIPVFSQIFLFLFALFCNCFWVRSGAPQLSAKLGTAGQGNYLSWCKESQRCPSMQGESWIFHRLPSELIPNGFWFDILRSLKPDPLVNEIHYVHNLVSPSNQTIVYLLSTMEHWLKPHNTNSKTTPSLFSHMQILFIAVTTCAKERERE